MSRSLRSYLIKARVHDRIWASFFVLLTIMGSPVGAREAIQNTPQIGTEIELRHNLHYLTYPVMAAHVLAAMAAPVAAGVVAFQVSSGEPYISVAAGLMTLAAEQATGFAPINGDRYWTDVLITRLMIKRMAALIRVSCPTCVIEDHQGRHFGTAKAIGARVIYPDGWWLQLGGDPMAVEITHAPVRAHESSLFQERLRRDVFENGARIGLRPSSLANNFSGTHFNIGLAIFKNRPLFLRNFLVHFYNHPELAMGIWQNDQSNARAITASLKGRQLFAADIAQFDALPEAEQTEDRLVRILHAGSLSAHGVALSVRNAQSETEEIFRRVELRASRSVESTEHLQIMMEILNAHLRYVETLRGRLDVLQEAPSKNPIVKLARYKEFIREIGYDWELAQKILPISYRVLNHPTMQKCAELLGR